METVQEGLNQLEGTGTTKSLHRPCHDQPRLEDDSFQMCKKTKDDSVPCFERTHIAQTQSLPDKKIKTVSNQYGEYVLKKSQ